MNQVAFVFEHITLYWYSIILALSVLAGVCFFLACASQEGIRPVCSAATVLLCVVLGALCSRFVFWYCRPLAFDTFGQAFTTHVTEHFTLAGAFAGCLIAAVLMHKPAGGLGKLLDCLSVAGCGAIALGRLAAFFTDLDRGQIVEELTHLPWAWPIVNPTSGQMEYRFATFLFQAIIAGGLFLLLVFLFFSRRRKQNPSGALTLLFLMGYCASQILLDSTRYDSLYLRSNGFVSMVQILAAIALAISLVMTSLRAIRAKGMAKWMIPSWAAMAALFSIAGFMEYYVQRHGRLALFSYSVMAYCLEGIVVLGMVFWISGWNTFAAERKTEK